MASDVVPVPAIRGDALRGIAGLEVATPVRSGGMPYKPRPTKEPYAVRLKRTEEAAFKAFLLWVTGNQCAAEGCKWKPKGDTFFCKFHQPEKVRPQPQADIDPLEFYR